MSTLYAIPTPLGGSPADALSEFSLKKIRALKDFAVENAKSARAFLGALGMPVRELNIEVLGDDVSIHLRGRDLGLLSEAGCPAIADPGAKLVEAAHAAGYQVVPLVGPSSIVLALMASGLEGQRFAFCGYLPRESDERKKRIKELENRSRREAETEIFIETPYRNDALLAALLETCAESTRLCVAADLTLADEAIRSQSIAAWRREPAPLGKRPAVFLLLAQGR
ncbi:MAG: rRNA (cytidine1402-2-O)-methyltransferase [Betaproteobacteria bacterium]|nr:rRNA (cytidine1402-2-O)-methyltransferase [Betaproteobacteria bacterium]